MIGRVAGNLIAGTVVATENNERLELHTELFGNGWLVLNDNQSELAAPLAGEIGDRELFCLFKNDNDNYPILNCRLQVSGEQASDGYLTLWPNG
ncbi:hypothetical protein RC74_07105 [Falsihalocynthiibacter arcticus]|uniref:Uncharacterized protein n=2 Tax=Falsihalocynthiibacter arcticus TaxID=1579316 RepID=A0A126UYD3_9RHOB|nr:hypothetical protein RC74_07105 [Falsihalocynthiibacter arcticus]